MKKLIAIIQALVLIFKLKRMQWRAGWRHFKRECAHADHLAKHNVKRYRVYFTDRYISLTKDQAIEMKKVGMLDKRNDIGLLSNLCLYDTMTKAHSNPQFLNRKLK
jgi:hypothetical protein